MAKIRGWILCKPFAALVIIKNYKAFLGKSVSILTVFLRKKCENFCAQQDVHNDNEKTEKYFILFIKREFVLISALFMCYAM